ncbi:MAG TPA: hypothetical protein VNM48_22685 [Chloroflexota bacterium]|nr:hypothetical protein [Chloroflexota bacterium]
MATTDTSAMSRPELEAHAEKLGLENPKQYQNIPALRTAIVAKEGGGDTGAELIDLAEQQNQAPQNFTTTATPLTMNATLVTPAGTEVTPPLADGQVRVKGIKPAGQAADRHTVVAWEKHPSHPDREIFVTTNGKTHTVALTDLIREKLREGALERA